MSSEQVTARRINNLFLDCVSSCASFHANFPIAARLLKSLNPKEVPKVSESSFQLLKKIIRSSELASMTRFLGLFVISIDTQGIDPRLGP